MYVEIINQPSTYIYAITELFSRTPHLQVTFCDLFISVLNLFITGFQDAAGGIMKRQADLAVLRGRCQIQNAMDLYNFGNNFLSPTNQKYVKGVFSNT